MKTTSLLIIFNVLFVCLFISNSCSVGALVNVKASDVDYPVSHSESFYSKKDSLIQLSQYKIQKEFSFSFTKWSVASLVDIEGDEDISQKLNTIIEKNDGDAIVDLIISVSNPAINGFSLVIKIISFWTALAGTGLTIAEPSATHAIITGSSILIYLYTPAAAEINIEGKVVKILN